jgi:hypothetical protein
VDLAPAVRLAVASYEPVVCRVGSASWHPVIRALQQVESHKNPTASVRTICAHHEAPAAY